METHLHVPGLTSFDERVLVGWQNTRVVFSVVRLLMGRRLPVTFERCFSGTFTTTCGLSTSTGAVRSWEVMAI